MLNQMCMDAVGESSSAAPQLKVSQQQPSRVIDDTKNELEPLRKAPSRQLSTADSAASQVAASDRQLSASLSSTCKVAELAQGQPEADLAEEEADLEPKHALSARQESESAEDDDYADEFESDELVAQPKSITMPPHKLYHNPLGGDESAEEAEQWDTQGSQLHHVAVSDNSLEEEDQPQAYGDDVAGSHMHSPAEVPHVKTQLRVAEGDSVKVQWSLNVSKDQPEDEDEEDDDQGRSSFSKMPPTPYPKRSIFSATADDDLLEDEHMRPCDASACVPHVKTQLSLSEEGEPMKVQWRLDVSKPEGGDDEEEGQDEGKGRFSKMPSTPFPRRSIFSASGNMADDVDIFSTTLPAEDSGSESAAESDFGGSLPRVSSDVRQDSAGESGMQLTPSYRQTQGRSLQQAADNEQPFATSWRPRPGPAQEADAVTPNLAPTRISMSQTPSRRSSLVQSQDTAAGEVTQSSLSTAGTSVHAKPAGSNEAAPAVVPSTLPSHASLPVQVSLNTPASVSSLSRQPSYVPGPASGVSSRRSSFSARVERETSQLLGSRQVSNAASMNAAEQPSQGASRTASLSSGANAQLGPVLSSRVLTPQAAAASEADRKVAKRSSFSKPASLSRETSGISRQASGGKSSAAVTAPIAASSRTASRQPSFSNPAALSRQPSQDSRQSSIMSTAGAEVPSPAASSVVSRQASQTQPAALSSRQASHISRQPSSAAGGLAPSKEGARQTSVDRPASAARQNSQRQVGRDDAMVPQSESTVSSRQQSLAARSLSGLQDADAHDLPAPGQLSSQSSMDSMSSQPHRSNSLEAMHQQMGMLGNRKPTAVGSVAPAAVGRKLSQEGIPMLSLCLRTLSVFTRP